MVCLFAHGYAQDYAREPAAVKTNIAAAPSVAGELISINLKDVDIQDALKVITEASGYNIVLDKDVQAKVTIILKGVSWQTALESILKTNNLTYKIQDNIIRVMTPTTIQKEEELLPLQTKITTLNFAKADTLQASLAKMLSSRGSMQVNIPTNSIIITDSPDALAKIEEIANKLDVRTPQVMIEALIMSIALTEDDQFGIDWGAIYKKLSDRYIDWNMGNITQMVTAGYGKTIFPQWFFNATMAYYAQDRRVNILASPRILTLDNLAAKIEIMEQVPYTYTSESTQGGTVSSTQFKDIGLILEVTPHITKDRFISIVVRSEQSYVAAFVGSTNEPQIDSRRANTNFMLRDGETIVIGGLRRKDNTTTVNKVPIISDLPIVGSLFKREVKRTTDTELVIFISPHIIETNLMSAAEEERFQNASHALDRNEVISKEIDFMMRTNKK